ncbi:MAG: hypothetical protein JRE40_15145 [Deltaproteobacteria bacterium]|nr:hypothetical protein [Deltaproteobacteria bacterium]
MIKLNFRWVLKTAPYQTGDQLYLNRICVGGYGWNDCQPKDSIDKSVRWAGYINLPSLKTDRVFGASEEEIRDKIEGVVTNWFNEATTEEGGR